MPQEFHPSTHPPLPPTTEDERVSWLRLLRSRRVGPSTFYRLMREHGSAGGALDALPDVARAAGVDDYTPCPPGVAQAELRKAQSAGACMICIGTPDYPASLLDLSDPPPILWAMGDTGLLDRDRIAMVGARNASSLGTRMARALATDLGRQSFVTVSGLARGIDTAVHLATLDTGTIAVMAGGVDTIYPAENTRLAEDIAARGLRLSEQPMGLPPQARHFPRRNRLISGLARAVVVVEAAAKSGSLITARDALDQGREVLAVPGHPFDARAAGCNMLIRDGATLVRRAEDVIEALPVRETPQATPDPAPATAEIPAPPPEKRSLRETAALHGEILNRLGPSPLAEDQLIRDLKAPARTVAPALTDLELEGRIVRHPGGLLARTN
ncbi:DNA processing protein [Lutimaribacter pacificus]|uniref:DNA protecting protein DprA n=1 Tax=Lutimaribacter pacificus TaxID=391948 RepID=A0A1H0BR00_9RHOB|nr:DNA-processing protein DprA [Lutimaribacter pacificus]SDN48012.1 DNA processing protein [Lutimaribacter pacificus]SHJ53225.1 DNA protecting protein DprA [Lutimaribacter pacificus]